MLKSQVLQFWVEKELKPLIFSGYNQSKNVLNTYNNVSFETNKNTSKNKIKVHVAKLVVSYVVQDHSCSYGLRMNENVKESETFATAEIKKYITYGNNWLHKSCWFWQNFETCM